MESSFVSFFGCGSSTNFRSHSQKKTLSYVATWEGERMRQSPRRVPNMDDKGEAKDSAFFVREGSINEGYPPLPAIATIPAPDRGCSSGLNLHLPEKKLGRCVRFFFGKQHKNTSKKIMAQALDLLDESCRSNLWSVFKLVAE